MVFFSSDSHLGHNKEFLYTPRGFKSIEEHNAAIIANWNSVVTDEDTVYVLGDLVLGDIEEGMRLLKQLKGKIIVIKGNHDSSTKLQRYMEEDNNIQEWYYAYELKYKKYYFWLSHYKTETANYDDDKPWAKHLINLHGHSHSSEKFEYGNPYQYNVALDAHNNFPVSIEQILEDIKNKKMEMDREV